MTQFDITGINEDVADILAKASGEQLTPASIIIEIFRGVNIVNEYLEKEIDMISVIHDLEEEHNSLIENNRAITEATVQAINELDSVDRYMTIERFTAAILSMDFFTGVFKNTLGKYMRIEHVIEDINNMLESAPNKNWDAKKETLLDVFGRDLSRLFLDGELPKIIGRDEEVQRMVQVLTRQTKANPILLGNAGVGKTALVEKLTEVIATNQVPQA